nr:hypothetical protein [Tanacetum cinerariifolium]
FDEKDGIGVTAGDLKLMLLGNLLLLFGLTKVGAVNLMLLVKKVNDVIQLHALINGKKVVVSEAIIRKDLHLDDANGVEYLPTEEIFMELARMGYEKPHPKLIFYKACSMASAVICLATVVMDNQVDDITSHNTRYTSPAFIQKVAELKQDKHSQALDILPLKKRVIKLEKKKRSKSSGFKRLRRVGTAQRVESSTNTILGAQEDASKQEGKIAAINADEDITLVDVEKDEEVVTMDVEPQGRINQEEVVTMDVEPQGRINQEGVNTASKEVSAAEATNTKRAIFKREYKKVQTLFKPDKDVEEPKKKRVIDETLLQKSFKKLNAVEVSGFESTQEIPSNDPKEMFQEDVQNMLEIVPINRVGGITEAYQSFEDILKGFAREDLVALWNLVQEKFSSAVPNEDKEKALWVELKRLFEPDADDVF